MPKKASSRATQPPANNPTPPNLSVHCAFDEMVPLEKLVPNPRNPNTHPPAQIEMLAKIIAHQGWRAPVVVSRLSGFIVAGHGRLAAAKLLGAAELPVDYQDFPNEADEWAHLIADNRIAELAEIDGKVLSEVLLELDTGAFDMGVAGFDQKSLEQIMTAFHPESEIDAEAQIDKAEELRVKWGVERGQVWKLGEHRLMCGDCTCVEDVRVLLAGEKAALCLTDPPYGIGEAYDAIKDTPENLLGIVDGFFPLARSASERMLITPGNKNQWIYPRPDWCLCWFVSAGTGRNSWGFSCWQPVLAYGKDPYLAKGLGSRPDGLAKTESAENQLGHPCAKPVNVWCWFLERGSISRGDLVYEPFSGSGTTIIACERLDRKCRAMEISPGYVAVAIQRWADATGLTPQLIQNGGSVKPASDNLGGEAVRPNRAHRQKAPAAC